LTYLYICRFLSSIVWEKFSILDELIIYLFFYMSTQKKEEERFELVTSVFLRRGPSKLSYTLRTDKLIIKAKIIEATYMS
jgi:hypothetical protein